MSVGVGRNRQATMIVALLVCYIANLWLTNVLRVQAGGIDTIWTANAFVIGALLILPRRRAAACLCVAFLVQTAVILSFGHAMFDAIGYSALTVVEAIAVVALARRLRAVRLTSPGRFATLIFLALTPVLLVGSGVIALVLWGMAGEVNWSLVFNRLVAKFLGMSLVLPGILLLAHRTASTAFRPALWEASAAYLLMACLAFAVFSPMGPVALMAIFPAITLLGTRMGPRAVTVAMVMVSGVLLWLGVNFGVPSLMLSYETFNRQVTMLQIYLTMVFATGTLAALVAAHQQRLRQLLLRRSQSHRLARDRAQAASLAKTDFLATMSHEVRTPLNAIIGFVQVLERRQDLAAESRHHIGLIGRSGDALLTVVNDILDFSKVEAGRIALDPKPVDLAAVCRDVIAIVADSASAKGLSLDICVEGELAQAYVCDDHRLGQVLLNFLNNAVKFTDVGGVTLMISATCQGDADLIRIAIVDTGPGIAPAGLAGLFQRFSQVDSTVSRNHGGTGLGLAICKGLVETMGGRVGVESTLGLGSTFFLEALFSRATPVAAPVGDQRRTGGMGAHVLLVDDHPMNRELGVTLLDLLGCTSDVACDGREAIIAVQTQCYDLILMDVHMPVVDGLAATRAIRALGGEIGATPIIAMSADVLPEQLARMRAAGMVDHVPKPVSVQVLAERLDRWTRRIAVDDIVAA